MPLLSVFPLPRIETPAHVDLTRDGHGLSPTRKFHDKPSRGQGVVETPTIDAGNSFATVFQPHQTPAPKCFSIYPAAGSPFDLTGTERTGLDGRGEFI
jgi:hypothetical protein